MEKTLKNIINAVNDYVAFVSKSESTAMEKFYHVGSLLVAEFPETSARDIAEKLGNIQSFGKSQVALAMKLARDFRKAPKLAIREYRILSGPLGKVENSDKRLELADKLHGKKTKEIQELFKGFGIKYGKDESDKGDKPDEPKAPALLTRRQIEDFAKLCKAQNMQGPAIEIIGQIFGYDIVIKATESARNAVTEKQNAARKLRKKSA